MKNGALFFLLLAGSAPAVAQVISIESANPLPAPNSNGKDLDKIVCETVYRTGSRLQVDKVCMTKLQWKEQRDGHRADLEKVQEVVNQQPTR